MNRSKVPAIDYKVAGEDLEREFNFVEAELLNGIEQTIEQPIKEYFDVILDSRTQAYREVLIGCVLVKLQNKEIDIHKPYMNQGPDAYNGRTLDEKVINPFLHSKQIPCSRGPFLSTFRRSVGFVKSTRDGLRDKEAFDALLSLIDYIASEGERNKLISFLRYLLFRFIELRNRANIPISHVSRMSLEQYDNLISALLETPSGGRFPVYLVEATFNAIKTVYGLSWEVEVLGINVADRASGAGGDITIKENNTIILAAEITERAVEKSRIVATFNTKIAPHKIEDYLFFIKKGNIDEDSLRQTRQYFSQGHELNFLEIKNWILMILATIGNRGRSIFNQLLVNKLSGTDIPVSLKLCWNSEIARITSS